MEGTPKTDAQIALSRLRAYVFAHGWASILVGVFLLLVSPGWETFGFLVTAIVSIPVFYLIVAGVVLLLARRQISKGDPDAPRWVRWAMAFALPGSLVIGVGATFSLIVGLATDPIGSILLMGPFAVVGLSSVFVLLRILLKTDLDRLMWANAGEPLDAALNFSEANEVELDFAEAAQEVRDEVEQHDIKE